MFHMEQRLLAQLERGYITHGEYRSAIESMKTKRAYLTKAERAAMALMQKGRCGCGCGAKLSLKAIGEHTTPLAIGGDEKPDALYNPDCAHQKTYGLRGDISNIAKVKRHRNGKTQYDKRKAKGGTRLKSRGFDKGLKRKLNGEVVRRGE